MIISVDRQPVLTIERLIDVIGSKEPGDEVRIEVYRGTRRKTLNVKLGRLP